MKAFFALLLSAALALPAGFATAADATPLEIGYMPILPVAPLFVELENGALEDAGIEPKLVQFQNGPAMVQALLSGQLDVAYLGIGPAMVARARGADIKVIASSIIDQVAFLARGELAPYFADGQDPASAFARFAQDKGRQPTITTFPTGSVPDTVLQYWLQNVLKVDADAVKIIYQGEAQAQQALLTGAVDGAALLEPIVSMVLTRQPDARVVASGSQLFPQQPGAVLAVRSSALSAHPQAIAALLKAHVAAAKQLNETPEAVAGMVGKYVGGGRLPAAVVQAALQRSQGNFVADPHRIVEGTARMQDFQTAQGTLKTPVDIDSLFDFSLYDAQAKP